MTKRIQVPADVISSEAARLGKWSAVVSIDGSIMVQVMFHESGRWVDVPRLAEHRCVAVSRFLIESAAVREGAASSVREGAL